MGKRNDVMASDKAKLGKDKILHPRSRKLKQAVRKEHRRAKLASQQSDRRQTRVRPRIALCAAVQARLGAPALAGVKALTLVQAAALARDYCGRFDAQLAAIEAEHARRPGQARKRAAHEDALRAAAKADQDAFLDGGLELPDVCDARTVRQLREWDGRSDAILQQIAFRLFREEK